ncbi:MAG: type 4a pilus biogenesis protein PilO [Deltaproteobacteria bacterium]|nr:type 4a pilus biogenesis protein PilO [Deltaproteobacteria bacterium]MBW1736257.1 type 4a pilus biogenesis protein PilO [Deltaproteobacteria bacterium]MBW2032593.1 type 4a pilus biogenesis protein PilO [Deltaproteobacteria bacterium]MBW2113564.1 type 4a pilus biogenesis protein PilO [Deltaproteobacteria bacterium]MBW2168602.1 type 4a pilus biogenesis protein PilO [Deltaproteobacteria bacterium]
MQESLIEKVEKIKMLYRILILAGTFLLLASVFVFLVYLPKAEKISQTTKEIAGLQKQINKARITIKDLAKLEKEEAQVDSQFKEALRLLPDKREIPSLLRSVTQLGNQSNLKFRLFRPMNERPRDFFIEIPVSVEVSGKYHNVALFFDRVGRMKRIINILNVSMVPEKPLSTKLKTTCEAITFRFKGN